jgi:hypothetical protein
MYKDDTIHRQIDNFSLNHRKIHWREYGMA